MTHKETEYNLFRIRKLEKLLIPTMREQLSHAIGTPEEQHYRRIIDELSLEVQERYAFHFHCLAYNGQIGENIEPVEGRHE